MVDKLKRLYVKVLFALYRNTLIYHFRTKYNIDDERWEYLSRRHPDQIAQLMNIEKMNGQILMPGGPIQDKDCSNASTWKRAYEERKNKKNR